MSVPERTTVFETVRIGSIPIRGTVNFFISYRSLAMTVVLWGINATKRIESGTLSSTPELEKRMLSLDDYYQIASRCIGAFASGSVAQSMLRNEDAISFVAEHLMYGTCRWTEDGGRTLRSYINQCAIWSIQRWIMLSKKAHGKHEQSLNREDKDGDRQFYETIADTSVGLPIDELCCDEEMQAIRQVMDDELTDNQRQCIELIYIQDLSGADVARQLKVSRQAVEQSMNKGLEKIRAKLNVIPARLT